MVTMPSGLPRGVTSPSRRVWPLPAVSVMATLPGSKTTRAVAPPVVVTTSRWEMPSVNSSAVCATPAAARTMNVRFTSALPLRLLKVRPTGRAARKLRRPSAASELLTMRLPACASSSPAWLDWKVSAFASNSMVALAALAVPSLSRSTGTVTSCPRVAAIWDPKRRRVPPTASLNATGSVSSTSPAFGAISRGPAGWSSDLLPSSPLAAVGALAPARLERSVTVTMVEPSASDLVRKVRLPAASMVGWVPKSEGSAAVTANWRLAATPAPSPLRMFLAQPATRCSPSPRKTVTSPPGSNPMSCEVPRMRSVMCWAAEVSSAPVRVAPPLSRA